MSYLKHVTLRYYEKKGILMNKLGPNFYFHSFALLIALRDVWSSLLLSKNVEPIFMVLIFCTVTTVFSLVKVYFSLGIKEGIINPFMENKLTVIKMGVTTALLFTGMLYGVRHIGATLFTTIEHGLIPFFSLFLALLMLKEKLEKHQVIGFVIALIGVQVLFIPSLQLSVLSATVRDLIFLIC